MYTDGVDDWISLGDLTNITCIVRPSECEPSEPATVLAWLKFDNCGNSDHQNRRGIISSYGEGFTSGFSFYCSGEQIR